MSCPSNTMGQYFATVGGIGNAVFCVNKSEASKHILWCVWQSSVFFFNGLLLLNLQCAQVCFSFPLVCVSYS